MPKDEWRRARNQTVARRVKFEIATGEPLSYEFLSEEITPLDQINVLTSRSTPSEPVPSSPTASLAKANPTARPAVSARKGIPASARFTVAKGVTVMVMIDGQFSMNIVQALEAALGQARNLSVAKPRHEAIQVMSDSANDNAPTPLPDGNPEKSDIAALREKLRGIGESIAAKCLLNGQWMNRGYGSWLQRLSEIQGLSDFAWYMTVLESNLSVSKQFRRRRKARRLAWRRACHSARTVRAVAHLLTEFEGWFQKV